MAAIMQCPSCGEFLAEEGDLDKGQNRNFYRVYDSVANLAEKQGAHRVLECFACKYIGDIEYWE
jgi:hypothetical protein